MLECGEQCVGDKRVKDIIVILVPGEEDRRCRGLGGWAVQLGVDPFAPTLDRLASERGQGGDITSELFGYVMFPPGGSLNECSIPSIPVTVVCKGGENRHNAIVIFEKNPKWYRAGATSVYTLPQTLSGV